MIYFKLKAGLGNQLYKYAAFRRVQTIVGQGGVACYASGVSGHSRLQLDQYKLTEDLTILPSKQAFSAALPAKLKSALARQSRFNGKALNRMGFITDKGGVIGGIVKGLEDYTLSGWFFKRGLIWPIQDQLRNEIQPINPLNEANQEMLRLIRSTPFAVCAHVRRGDFLKYRYFNICSKSYYTRAVQKMLEVFPEARFFVFSDDMPWVKNSGLFPESSVFVDINSERDAVAELELMRSCRHFLISNSTFGFWAQFLCDNPDKIIVEPNHNKRVKTVKDTQTEYGRFIVLPQG